MASDSKYGRASGLGGGCSGVSSGLSLTPTGSGGQFSPDVSLQLMGCGGGSSGADAEAQRAVMLTGDPPLFSILITMAPSWSPIRVAPAGLLRPGSGLWSGIVASENRFVVRPVLGLKCPPPETRVITYSLFLLVL